MNVLEEKDCIPTESLFRSPTSVMGTTDSGCEEKRKEILRSQSFERMMSRASLMGGATEDAGSIITKKSINGRRRNIPKPEQTDRFVLIKQDSNNDIAPKLPKRS